MEKIKLTEIHSTAVPLQMENVDTDQIIPARFLKSTTKEGFGKNLFRDWRYDGNGHQKKDFVLNDSTYSGEILIAGKNFGCGSSREHAAWALVDYGFKAVVSSFFADIFKGNALNNSLLPIIVSEDFLQHIFSLVEKDPNTRIHIDLEKQSISTEEGRVELFDINSYKKLCIINGYDDVEYLRSMQEKTETFEKERINDFSINYQHGKG